MLHLLHSIRAEFDSAAQEYPKLFHAVIKHRSQDRQPAKTYQHYVCVLAADTMWPRTFIVPNEGCEGVAEYGSTRILSHDPVGSEGETAHIASGECYQGVEQFLEVLGAKAYHALPKNAYQPKAISPYSRKPRLVQVPGLLWLGFVYSQLRGVGSLVWAGKASELTFHLRKPVGDFGEPDPEAFFTYLKINPFQASAVAIDNLISTLRGPGNTPLRPFGRSTVKDAGGRTLSELEAAAKRFREEELPDGKHRTFGQVADELNRQGFKKRNGKAHDYNSAKAAYHHAISKE